MGAARRERDTDRSPPAGARLARPGVGKHVRDAALEFSESSFVKRGEKMKTFKPTNQQSYTAADLRVTS